MNRLLAVGTLSFSYRQSPYGVPFEDIYIYSNTNIANKMPSQKTSNRNNDQIMPLNIRLKILI